MQEKRILVVLANTADRAIDGTAADFEALFARVDAYFREVSNERVRIISLTTHSRVS